METSPGERAATPMACCMDILLTGFLYRKMSGLDPGCKAIDQSLFRRCSFIEMIGPGTGSKESEAALENR